MAGMTGRERTRTEGRRERLQRQRPGRDAEALRPLGELRPWERCVVQRVDGEWKLRRRLAELGFLPGTPVQVGRMAPMGDPIELRIRGYRITLSREQALRIWVSQAAEGRQGAERRGQPGSTDGGQGRWKP